MSLTSGNDLRNSRKSGKFRENIEEKLWVFCQMSAKLKVLQNPKNTSKICGMVQRTARLQFGAVEKHINLLDLKRYCKMTL